MDHKYTDADVRRNRDALTALAVRYLQQYVGDFTPLLEAKQKVNSYSDLPVPMVRLVLNCMRVDPTVQNLPTPVSVTFDATIKDLKKIVPRRTIHRPAYIRLTTKFKRPFGIHLGMKANRIHRVWETESHIRYYPAVGEYNCRLRWHCKPSWQIKEANVKLIGRHEANHLIQYGFAPCGTCEAYHSMRKNAEG